MRTVGLGALLHMLMIAHLPGSSASAKSPQPSAGTPGRHLAMAQSEASMAEVLAEYPDVVIGGGDAPLHGARMRRAGGVRAMARMAGVHRRRDRRRGALAARDHATEPGGHGLLGDRFDPGLSRGRARARAAPAGPRQPRAPAETAFDGPAPDIVPSRRSPTASSILSRSTAKAKRCCGASWPRSRSGIWSTSCSTTA